MEKHAKDVLGVQILLRLDSNTLLSDALPMVPPFDERRYTSTAETSGSPAMIFPRGAEIFTIYIDANKGLFVRTQDKGFYVLQRTWGAIVNFLPPDSTCRVLVYKDNCGRLKMGVFDLTKLQGRDIISDPIFERQKALFDLWRDSKVASEDIVHHWVGMEGSLLTYMKNKTFVNQLQFEVDNILRIQDSDGNEDNYKLVLRPLFI
jgi:hypothetical protein